MKIVSSTWAAWGWMLPLLLLTTALTMPRLDMDGLWYDEVWSVINAGGAHYGAMSPGEIWQHLATNDPDQGIAYPLMLSAWGSIAGWSEFSTRILSLFAGLLTIAGVYRLGREWFTPSIGLLAALFLGVNAFYINYLHELRVFSIVTLAAVLVLWCYGRIMFTPISHDFIESISKISAGTRHTVSLPEKWMLEGHENLRGEQANIQRGRNWDFGWLFAHVGLVVGGLGLLYTHYFAATLLVALAIVHIGIGIKIFFYEEEKKNWWRIVLLALGVALLFAPWLPVLASSFARTSTRNDVHERALTTLNLLDTIAGYFFNLNISGIGMVLVLGLFAVAGVIFWKSLTSSPTFYSSPVTPPHFIERGTFVEAKIPQRWRRGVLLSTTILLLITVVAANAILQIIEPNRARYVLILWAPLAISVSALQQVSASAINRAGVFRWIVPVIALLWLLNGLWAYYDADFLQALDGGETARWRTMTTILQHDGQTHDVFVFYAGTPKTAYNNQFSFEHSTHDLMMPHFQSAIFLDEAHRDWAQTQITQAHRVWYGVDKRQPITEAYTVFEPLLADFILCTEVVNDTQLTFTLYARYAAFCPADVPIATFEAGIELMAYEFVVEQNRLFVPTSWRLLPNVPPDVYSVSVQLLDNMGNLITQQDTGLSHSHFVTLLSKLDVSDLASGDYGVRMVVYAWQTGIVVGEIILDDEFSYSQ